MIPRFVLLVVAPNLNSLRNLGVSRRLCSNGRLILLNCGFAKINRPLPQAVLTQRRGERRVYAEKSKTRTLPPF